MALLVFVITVIFACIGFFSNQPQTIIGNSFYTYYVYVIRYIVNNSGWFMVGFGLVVLGDYVRVRKKFLFSVYRAGQVFFLGLLLSSILLYSVAFAELNIMAMIFNHNPKSLGVVTQVDLIVESLRSFTKPPQIIASDKDQKIELYAIAQAAAGKDNFYGNFILTSLPRFLVLPIKKPESSLLLIDNTLVVTEINPLDMQEISPVIGYLFVSRNFSNRAIKSFPKVMILNQEEYQNYRKEDFKRKLLNIDELIIEAGDNVSSVSSKVKTDKELLELKQSLVKNTYEQQDKEYQKCISTGKYVGKDFMRSKTDEYCATERQKLNEIAATASLEGDRFQAALNQDEKLLAEYQLYKDFLQSQIKVGEALIQNIPHELGAFDPPETIRLTIENTNSHAVADYFETLTHEYMHYASHISEEKKFSDTFWEESLAEYFARTAIQNDLNISTNLGYPAAAKIISKITKRIPETELADVYFSKDQERLQKVLDRVYGDHFYQNNRILFNTLQYASDNKQILLLANMIMEKIGGEPMTEKDLLSTFSSLD